MQGKVVSTKMHKTVVVSVQRVFAHPLYKKIMRKNKKYKAHNETVSLAVGDIVSIVETRPISKEKRFAVDKIIKKV